MRTPEGFGKSAANACGNAALIPFLCYGVRVGSVCGCCTAVQAAVPASLASPKGLWHMFFLNLVYFTVFCDSIEPFAVHVFLP